jgi:hypothetical protein
MWRRDDDGRDRLAPAMKWAGRIIASIGASWFLLVFIGELMSEESQPFTLEGATVVVVGVVAIAGAALSWWRERPATAVLVLASILIAAHIAVYAGRHHVLAWLSLGLPFLLAGGLLRGSERRLRKAAKPR